MNNRYKPTAAAGVLKTIRCHCSPETRCRPTIFWRPLRWVQTKPSTSADCLTRFDASGQGDPRAGGEDASHDVRRALPFPRYHHEGVAALEANRQDLVETIERVQMVLYAQKFAGAAADLLNANIIARDLGLADKSELTGKDGGPVELKEMSDIEQARRIAFALGRAMLRLPAPETVRHEPCIKRGTDATDT